MTITYTFSNPYPTSSVKELLEHHLLIPRKIRHFLRMKKHVLINHQPINWQSEVKTGDMISLTFDDDDYPEKKIPFGNPKHADVLYEDQHIIVVNKPEGLKTHGNHPKEIALLNHVAAYINQTAYVVHRLDMETSGAVIFAKNPFILPILNRLLEDKKIYREYWAAINSTFPHQYITYKDKIGRHRHDRRLRRVDIKQGQNAITNITLLKSSPTTSLLHCQLETGRTHQIRVHLSHHGYPIIGDPLYGSPSPHRLMLHAHKLSFVHPLTLEHLSVTAPSLSFETTLTQLMS